MSINLVSSHSLRALGMGLGFFGLLMTPFAQAAPQLRDTCLVSNPEHAPADFMWGLAAYHVPLPGYELYPEDFQKMAANGIKWISVDFAWKRIEPTQGAQYNFTYFDMLTQEAAKNGIQIVGRLANGYNKGRAVSPEWTAKLGADDYLTAMDHYARAVVSRYGNTVKYWAMENELNIDQIHVRLGWRDHPWAVAVKDRIIQTLNDAIHQSSPGTLSILTVATAPNYENYIAQITPKVNYDIVGLYQYPALTVPVPVGFENQFCQSASNSRKASRNKPIMMLETGFQTSGIGRTAKAQAAYMVTAARAALSAGMEGLFIYQYLDNPDEQVARERHFGLLNEDRVAKPAWTAYGEAIKKYSAQN